MHTDFEAIYRNPGFTEMVRRKRKVSYILSLIMSLIFLLYMGAMAYARDFLSAGWVPGSPITNGIVLTLAVICASILLSGYYIWWANRHFDVLQKALLEELKHD
jgi:uncharacterized membrane protein (DUF485 family)